MINSISEKMYGIYRFFSNFDLCMCVYVCICIYNLFFQEDPIEIKINLFFQGVLAKMAILKCHIINT